jgi:hypothetical protein
VLLSAVLVTLLSSPGESSVAIDTGETQARVTIDGQLFTEYRFADADRPYFYPVIAPNGENITRHWPISDTGGADEEHDHPHHRSLWFTHGAVNGRDFWHGGKIAQTRIEAQGGEQSGTLTTENEWRHKGKIVCTDVRTHTFSTIGSDRAIDFEITIKASHGKLVLGDTKEGSMAIRVAPTLRLKGKVAKGRILNSEGVKDQSAWGKRAKWCNYAGPLGGKPAAVTIMDHPRNPRHPTWWMARDYGLFAANAFGISHFEKKKRGAGNLTVAAGANITFRYRFVFHDGAPDSAALDQLYAAYAGPSDVSSKRSSLPSPPDPGMASIFNGRDFTGWKVPKGNIWWTVQDGILSVKNGPKKKGSILWTEKQFRDFIVECDFRFGEGTIDSGVFLRTEKQQVQLGISGSLKRDMTGSVYVPGRGYPKEAKGVKELLKPRDWNRLKVRVVGNVYTIWLNGTEVLVFEGKKAIPEGPIGLQLHPGKVMAIDFRRICVEEL